MSFEPGSSARSTNWPRNKKKGPAKSGALWESSTYLTAFASWSVS